MNELVAFGFKTQITVIYVIVSRPHCGNGPFYSRCRHHTHEAAALLMRSKFEQTKPEADAELDLSPREVWYRNNDLANFESETYASTLMRVITPREILGCFSKVPTCVQNWPRLNVFYFYYEITADLYWKCVH